MRFFILQEEPMADSRRACSDVLKADGTKYGDAPRCPKCGDFVGLRQWLPPFRVEIETWGTEFADVAITGTDLLVSLHFKSVWEASELIGLYGFEEVEVVKLKQHRKIVGGLPRYFRAEVQRSVTSIDQAASGFEWNNPPTCTACRLGDIIKRWKGVVIEEDTWNGDDVFIACGLSGEIIVSERFKSVCEQNSMKNVTLKSAESYGHDFYPWERGIYK